jgi:hypothetical protein
VSAQFYQPPQTTPFPRPVISPYMNLFRPGGNFTQNYFGLVQPQQQFYNGIQQLRRDDAALAQGLVTTQAQIAANGQQYLPPTGSVVGFQTQSRYFMTLGRGGAGRVGAPAAGATASAAGARPQALPQSPASNSRGARR